MPNMESIWVSSVLLLTSCSALQETRDPTVTGERAPIALGAEVQAYPAGVITAVHAQLPFSANDVVTLRLGYNATDRRDFGEHDDETGGGFGGGAGYRHYFGEEFTGWLGGARVDLWNMDIDWKEDDGSEGSTDILVLMPTIEGGYGWRLGKRWRLDVTVALGAEVNVDTDGEDVGEGAILLAGVNFVYEF
jgi:hypothetical protein